MSGTISILGAGKLCAVMARLAITTGHRVLIARSGDPERIRPIMEALAPGAEPVTALQAARKREVIVLPLPVGKYRSLPWKASAGKLLIDSTKYRWEVGPPYQHRGTGIPGRLPRRHGLQPDGLPPPGRRTPHIRIPDRKGMAVAGNKPHSTPA